MNWNIEYKNQFEHIVLHQEFESFAEALASIDLPAIKEEYDHGSLSIVILNRVDVIHFECELTF
jgi:hypothetical protein